MCGLAGTWAWRPASRDILFDTVTRMTRTLGHRGPDDEGVHAEAESGLVMGFRRLSVIDVSPAGHQPMISADRRLVMAFNGEIYNHRDLRAELTGVAWRGTSDTEVLIEAFARWGIDATLTRLLGMFAIALWDRQTRTLTLIRDRVGKKPLYYAARADGVLWASELKALRAAADFDTRLDDSALEQYFRVGYVPAPLSIYRGARKLEPGSYLSVRMDQEPCLHRYWSAREAAHRGTSDPIALDEVESVDALRHLLTDAVSRRMIADVPLGAFLSGGIDSSTVVALMQASTSRPVRTFSIGFSESAYNEAPFAKCVAQHLHTDHTELYVDPQQARDVIPRLPGIFDEPFADSSQIPTLLISQLARGHVTVALSGDGGDEVFAGYNRHVWLERIWKHAARMPLAARRLVSQAIQAVPEPGWDVVYGSVAPVIGRSRHVALAGDKLHKVARVIDSASPDEAYDHLVSLWPEPGVLLARAPDSRWPVAERDRPAEPGRQSGETSEADLARLGVTGSAMLLDQLTYLPDDILTKVDRASMAVSLEVRVPLLDHRVVEWAWRLPPQMRGREGLSKWLLRQVLYEHVPPSLVERPKAGFGIPIGRWLRGDLREWAEELLSPTSLARAGLHAAPIREAWRTHLQGRRDWHHRLWTVLMFQAWHERWVSA